MVGNQVIKIDRRKAHPPGWVELIEAMNNARAMGNSELFRRLAASFFEVAGYAVHAERPSKE